MSYTWRLGDVFTNGTHRWRVDSISGDKAVLQSCSTSWAWTRLLTFDEWREGGRWNLETPVVGCEDAASLEPAPSLPSEAK